MAIDNNKLTNILHEFQAEIDRMNVSQSNKCSSRTRDANHTDTPTHTWYQHMGVIRPTDVGLLVSAHVRHIITNR